MAPPSTAPENPPIAPLHTYLLGDLPYFRPTGGNEQVSNVSNSARGVSFPMCAISSGTNWFEEGQEILTKIEKKVNSAARRRLHNVGMPASPIVDADEKDLDSDEKREKRRGPVEHKHEADVVGSSRQFLLDPIERALWYVCRLDFTSGAEITLSGGQDAPLLSGRSDVAFIKNKSTKSFAVLEYKKRGVISQEETSPQFIILEEAVDAVKTSLFEGNWDRLIRQASLYATLHETKFVALFDWDTLALMEFHRLAKPKGEKMHKTGKVCRIDIIKDSNQIRLALLGFLHRAYNDGEPPINELGNMRI